MGLLARILDHLLAYMSGLILSRKGRSSDAADLAVAVDEAKKTGDTSRVEDYISNRD